MDTVENSEINTLAAQRLMMSVAETYSRSAVGGYLYLVGWGALSYAARLHENHVQLAIAVAVAFFAIAMLRQHMRPPQAVAATRSWLTRYTCVVLASGLLWGCMQAWMLLDERVGATVKNVSLIGTIAYATVFAHLYATSMRLAVGGIVMMILPTLAILWSDSRLHPMAATLTLYSMYLAVAVIRSHRDYQRQLDLHEELSKQRDLYAHLSRTDALTGLFNRRHFSAVLERLTQDAHHDSRQIALLLVDVDHFKAINDRHGHVIGDAALKSIADLMQQCFRVPGSILARVGGEEFAIVLQGMDQARVRTLAEQFRSTLAASPLACAGVPVWMTASMGIGYFDADTHLDEDGFYRAVDAALYVAKSEGRNRTMVATH
ncbi:MAG: GGDEF domain-containing protein [Dokdonella sp.]